MHVAAERSCGALPRDAVIEVRGHYAVPYGALAVALILILMSAAVRETYGRLLIEEVFDEDASCVTLAELDNGMNFGAHGVRRAQHGFTQSSSKTHACFQGAACRRKKQDVAFTDVGSRLIYASGLAHQDSGVDEYLA